MNATAQLERQSVMMRYCAKAKQYLYDHDRLDYSTEDMVMSTADWLRHRDFREAIKPYLRAKEQLIGQFFNLQTTFPKQMPEKLTETLALYDEMIDGVAQQFGYTTKSTGVE